MCDAVMEEDFSTRVVIVVENIITDIRTVYVTSCKGMMHGNENQMPFYNNHMLRADAVERFKHHKV